MKKETSFSDRLTALSNFGIRKQAEDLKKIKRETVFSSKQKYLLQVKELIQLAQKCQEVGIDPYMCVHNWIPISWAKNKKGKVIGVKYSWIGLDNDSGEIYIDENDFYENTLVGVFKSDKNDKFIDFTKQLPEFKKNVFEYIDFMTGKIDLPSSNALKYFYKRPDWISTKK